MLTSLSLCLLSGNGWRRREKGELPEALQTVVQLFGPETLKERLNEMKEDAKTLREQLGGTEEYKAVLEEWKREFTKVRDSSSIAHNSNLM